MGIPGLANALQPYAENVRQNNKSKRLRAVLDGPGLAHDIYYRLLVIKGPKKNGIEAIPSYAELAQEVVPFLRKLENVGFEMQAKEIYFDGLLPTVKNHIRSERLARCVSQLQAYRSSHPDLLGGRKLNDRRAPSGSIGRVPDRLHVQSLPPPPFLVPLVIETLLASEYCVQTFVVPHEADEFCAGAFALGERDAVLTSDSDLLMLCPNVVFFKDLNFGTDISGDHFADVLYYRVEDIRKRLGVSDWLKFAFHLGRDPARSISLAVKGSKDNYNELQDSSLAQDWQNFTLQYGHEYSSAQEGHARSVCALHSVPQSKAQTSFHHILTVLDPRISELVQQWLWDLPAETSFRLLQWNLRSPLTFDPAYPDRTIYLPYMLDDPRRASTWKPSLPIRRFAYSTLALGGPVRALMEVDRRGDRCVKSAVALIPVHDFADQALALASKLHNLRAAFAAASDIDAWRCAAQLLLLDASTQGSDNPAPPSARDVQLVFSGAALPSWDALHAKAQVDAALYSLRMLKQTLDVACAAGTHVLAPAPLQAVQRLRLALRSLPGICDLHNSPAEGFGVGEDARDGLMQRLARFYGEERSEVARAGQTGDGQSQGGPGRSGRAERKGGGRGERVKVQQDKSNMYNALSGLDERDV